MASYLNPLTRDEVFEFDGVSKDVWDGQQRYDDMKKEFIERYKKFKALCIQTGNSKKEIKKKRTKGRPRKKKTQMEQDESWNIYNYKRDSLSNVETDDSEDSSDDEEEKIPTEIEWYEAFDIETLPETETMKNPLAFYKQYGKEHLFYFEQIAKWSLVTPLTSVGAEALFNDCGNTRSARRAQLTEQLASEIDAIQKWTRTFGTNIQTYTE